MVSWNLNFLHNFFFCRELLWFQNFGLFKILWRIYVLFLFVPLQGVLWFQSFVSSYVYVPLQRVAVEVFLPRRLPGHGPHRGGQTGGVQELQEVWIHDEPHADFNHRHPVYKRFCKIGVLLHFLLYLKKEISISDCV